MRVLISAVMILGLGSVASAAGNEQATTTEVPAALKALNVDSSMALTRTEALTIRGHGGKKYGHHKRHHRGHGLQRFSSIENYLGVQSITGDIYISGKNIRIGSHNHHFSIK